MSEQFYFRHEFKLTHRQVLWYKLGLLRITGLTEKGNSLKIRVHRELHILLNFW